MDFYAIKKADKKRKEDQESVFPEFLTRKTKDLMVRSKSFYAVWDQEAQLWSKDDYTLRRLVDEDLHEYADKHDCNYQPLLNYSNGQWKRFRDYLKSLSDNLVELDSQVTFASQETRREDYASKRLPYDLREGECPAYRELATTLYDPHELRKLEWAIGSILAGDARHIQKFIVLYGSAGAGKSTYINIIQQLFEGYYAIFDAKDLVGTNNQFGATAFASNPLVAIQHDGDLSRISDNSKLNSIVAHEEILINEKFKPPYTSRSLAFMFLGTNKPVHITDAKSGLARRLIDVMPSGRRLDLHRYQTLTQMIPFELGAIAAHCLEVYRSMGKGYYEGYRPLEMMFKTDMFFNFVEDHFSLFREEEYITLTQAYALYKLYSEEVAMKYPLGRVPFREELKNYFENFHASVTDRAGNNLRYAYSGFKKHMFELAPEPVEPEPISMTIDSQESMVNDILEDCPAQYANDQGTPIKKWEDVTTTLKDLDVTRLHYVKPPVNHIVIDFDLQENGEKSAQLNLEAASQWPPTYSEWSQGGSGIHLHYIYNGDATELSRIFSPGIEIKVFTGNASLRRRFIASNGLSVERISEGLPVKEKKVLNQQAMMSERGLRELIIRNLNREIHASTKPSMDFIDKILKDAYHSGMKYDVTDMRQAIMTFALSSTNQSLYCIELVADMKFKSDDPTEIKDAEHAEQPIVLFDCEVFPNLFLVNWKLLGEDKPITRMINPSPAEVEALMQMRLVGFNNRKYDNHILYARLMGYSIEKIYELSQKIIENSRNGSFSEAYGISYTDVYDFASIKMSLKKWQHHLGIKHKELGLPWDEPVPEERWPEVSAYCDNDVISLEAVWNDRHADFLARQILADLSGLTVNDPTAKHTARIIFGKDRDFKDEFVYTDLSEDFPGYKFYLGKSLYRDEDPSEGGYVHAETGIWTNCAVIDVASMHPTSIVQLNLFGKYTKNFEDILNARLAIKHKKFSDASKMLGGKLAPYLEDESEADNLAYALKIIINIVYGLTSARFDNPFKDMRNHDNIVAKRGALFMIDLKHYVQEQGFVAAHIKTDSIKIPEATPEIIEKVMAFGKKYGYSFEHEATYEKMCLVNDAVYVAKVGWAQKASKIGTWEAVGAQFQQPYVFKTLFSRDEIAFDDMTETKAVTTALYLDMNEDDPETHNYRFIGRVGRFAPVISGAGGGLLMREKEGEYHAASGTKGYRWLEADMVQSLGLESQVDRSYYDNLVDKAVDAISKYGDFEWFIS